MTDIDTLRWGDQQQLILASGGGESVAPVSKQMLQAHWQRPLLWKVLLSMQPFMQDGETVTWEVTATMTIGVGQATVTVPFIFEFAPNGSGVYTMQNEFFDIPAQDIQLQFKVAVQGGGQPTNPAGQSFIVAALAAPFTEPRVMADLRDLMVQPLPPRADPHSQHNPPWMGPGFDDGELRYNKGGQGY